MQSYLSILFNNPEEVHTCLNDSFQHKDHYHNITHSLHFMQNVWDGFQHYGLTCPRWVLVAALCHDAGHLQSDATSDKDNIQKSLAFVKKHQKLLELSDEECVHVMHYIELTEFPRQKQASTLEEKIFMDADFLEIRHPEWQEQFQYLVNEDSDKKQVARERKSDYNSDIYFLTQIAPVQTDWAKQCIHQWASTLQPEQSCLSF